MPTPAPMVAVGAQAIALIADDGGSISDALSAAEYAMQSYAEGERWRVACEA